MICMVPIFMIKRGTFKVLTEPMLRGFGFVCVAIALDLACTNVALPLLSVALQQCIRGTSPAVTLLVERVLRKKAQPRVLYVVVVLLCVGPVITALGRVNLGVNGRLGSMTWRLIYVYCTVPHSRITRSTAHKKCEKVSS